MTLAVHVDRVVLDGLTLTSAERAALGPALEAELTHRLANLELAPDLRGGAAVPRLSGGTVELAPAAGLAALLSTAVARGLGCA